MSFFSFFPSFLCLLSFRAHWSTDRLTHSLFLFQSSTTYHDWLASPDFLPDPPDLVLAFNSGISERPSSWKPTVLALLERRVPVVFTSLNEMEANADASAIWRMGGDRIERLWDEEKNPWASGREHFDVFSPGLIWSENMYWFGFRGV